MLGTTGCLFRSHRVQARRSNAPLKVATREELVARINQLAASVRTMNATVDIDTTVGGEKTGRVVEYQQIRGYIFAQKPAMLRMIGLMPIVRNRAFDMVSDGDRFKLSIPPRNRFITGSNQVRKISNNALENLRPNVIYQALLLPEIDLKSEIVVLEQGVQQVVDEKTNRSVTQANYCLLIITHTAENSWHLDRKIYFNRADLLPYHQVMYNDKGAVTTDITYSGIRKYNGILYPSLIEIVRPEEEYSIVLKMVKLVLNEPLKPEQFQLEMPLGATLTELK